MSRLSRNRPTIRSARFVNGQTGLRSIASPLSAAPCTIFAWAWMQELNSATSHRIATFCVSGGSTTHQMGLLRTQGALPGMIAAAASSTTTPDSMAYPWRWVPIMASFAAADDRTLYVGGVARGSSAVSRVPSGINCMTIGSSGSNTNVVDAYLALPSFWNTALGPAEAMLLARGEMPWRVRRSALVACVPDVASGRDYTRQYDFSIIDTTKKLQGSQFLPPRLDRAVQTRKFWWVPGGGAQTVEVGLNAETDSAFALTWRKLKAVGLNTETDSVLALSKLKAKAVGLTAETDSVLALSKLKIKAVGLNTETDDALPLVVSTLYPVGLAEETDSTLAPTSSKAKAIGLTAETDSALAPTHTKAKAIGLTTETDTPLPVTARRSYLVGLLTTVASAFALTWRKLKAVGLAQETDSSFAVEGGAAPAPGYVLKYPLVSNLARLLTQRIRGRSNKPFWSSN